MKIHCHLINLFDKAYTMFSGHKSPARTQSSTILNFYEKVLSHIIGTQISQIGRVFTDFFNPYVSVSNKIVEHVSAFICVHLRLIKISRMLFSRFIYAEVP